MVINLFFQTLQQQYPMCILGTQAMNPNIGHTTILINYQIIWSQLITPIILVKLMC